MIVGIDPDLKKSGVCTMNMLGEICALDSLDIVDLVNLVKDSPIDTIYAIEDVNKIKGMYSRNIKGGQAAQLKVAQDVGMVKATAQIITQLIQAHTHKPIILTPVGLGKQLKNNADLFRQVTGYQRPTNEDKRDAWAIANWTFKNLERLR